MIVETALMTVTADSEEGFQAALDQARHIIAAAPGFRFLNVHRGVERPRTFLLTIGWVDLAAHLEGFRESEAFGQWRALLSPYYAEPPVVEHWSPVPGLRTEGADA